MNNREDGAREMAVGTCVLSFNAEDSMSMPTQIFVCVYFLTYTLPEPLLGIVFFFFGKKSTKSVLKT